MADQAILFEDMFEVQQKDPDGKKFDRVSRYFCKSELFEFDLALDVNIDVYPLKVGDKFNLTLARTLNKDGSAMSNVYDKSFPTLTHKETLMSDYEYVMCGKVFKYADQSSGGQVKVEVYVSFGGLLMKLVGDPSKLQVLTLDSKVFLLMRKL